MKYFVALISDQNGRPIGTATISHDDRAGSVAVMPTPFTTDAAAAAYRQQLAKHYGLPTGRHDSGAQTGSKRQRVKHMMSGEIFPSAAAAARSIGCSTTMMVRHLRHSYTTRDIRGQTFVYIDADGRDIAPKP